MPKPVKYLEEVIISLGPKQSVTVTTKGFKGAACKAATKSIEAAFGGDVISDVDTKEMTEKPVQATVSAYAKASA